MSINPPERRKILLSMMVSLDGYIEGEHKDISWHVWNREMDAYMMDLFATVDTFIYGRKSYELMLEYWPEQHGEFAQVMNTRPKLVFSKTLQKATWNATIQDEVDPITVQKLKERPGKDMVLFAGADLAHHFMKFHLIDEYRIIVNPVILGKGKRLFQDTGHPFSLTLKESVQFACGNMLLHYSDPKAV
ncbi:dihydrofolate reductase [Echinicola strongylocentroti]|uniref:Dihydrofolate reductase n=1 Tax=Echinicola strongylocentroti TaxID=1795355 RepID=A0A2Z4IKF3_9BACT|nr:dihydrofolate reductase family protein [Echinicola strongylocentroti]AWW31018.1 dihydrofolate reductase [Echinicola strongylocentroti]